jgi:uncharacterized small protein (DUF1192 family)
MSNNASGYVPWADDDDDGTLDVYDVEALKSRIATLSAEPARTPVETQLTIRSRPLTESNQATPNMQLPSKTPRSTKSNEAVKAEATDDPHPGKLTSNQRRRKRAKVKWEKSRQREEDIGSPAAMTATGVPLVPSSKMSTAALGGNVKPEVWKAFAESISEPAAPQATKLFEYLQRDQTSEDDATASLKKQLGRRK